VPAQHLTFEAARLPQGQYAFKIGDRRGAVRLPDRHVIAIAGGGIVGDHAIEEGRWRQLFLVADDDNPPTARDEAQGIFRAHLACLVDDEEIEIDRTRRQKLRDGDRTHEEDRFDLLNRASRYLHQLAQRHVTALAANLGAYHAHAALGAAWNRRLVPGAHASHRGLARLLLELTEKRDKRVVAGAVEASKPGVPGDRFFPAGFGEGRLDFQKSVLRIELSRGKHTGDPGGSAGARLPIGCGEPCPFLETVGVSGPSRGPLAQPVEVDRGN
jgi:hypothetical protein